MKDEHFNLVDLAGLLGLMAVHIPYHKHHEEATMETLVFLLS